MSSELYLQTHAITALVSTVDLRGIEHDEGKYFETAVITDVDVVIVERYAEASEAIIGHNKWVSYCGGKSAFWDFISKMVR